MFARVYSFGVQGLNGFPVTVEADISGGLPQFTIVGLPDSAVKESADRVRSAVKNLGFSWPPSRITVNLAPADVRKTGPVYDLPVFLALLTAVGQLPQTDETTAFVGELALDGVLRPVAGILPMAMAAAEHGVQRLFVPLENAAEAASVENITVFGARTAREVVEALTGQCTLAAASAAPLESMSAEQPPDFSDVRGQPLARRAMEIAAAGGHNVLLIGPPGTGKSMLAKRLPGILPPLSRAEALECTGIYSVAGMLPSGSGLMTVRPFRSPHHSVSSVALSGGGTALRPGEVSLAHNGVLFLDELPEFSRDALEILRQPVEDGHVTISRASGTVTYPSRFTLVAAMNPCPCGYFGHPSHPCTCTPSTIERYRRKISGPLLDRIDLHVDVPPLQYEELNDRTPSESSADILSRVLAARAIQQQRYQNTNIHCNCQLPSRLLRRFCALDGTAQTALQDAFRELGLSARAHDRILRVARTIADLSGSETIRFEHVQEALQFRSLDRKYWYDR